MNSNRQYQFFGDGREPSARYKETPDTPEPYISAPALVRAVNLAIHLQRPLLLEGEAGCGKTKLARALAYELGLPFYPWYVNSRTRVEEGLYQFDAIGRLHDVQVERWKLMTVIQGGEITASESPAALASEETAPRRNPDKPDDYLRYGPLAKAFSLEDYPAVVLIDEIDKANIDFSNDLLTTLDDDYKFTIPETGNTIIAKRKPIIIITSNREKGDLPEPFLRRCIYFFVEFPGEEDLKKIVREHYRRKEENTPSGKLIQAAISRFIAARASARAKRPGTSEFLDWVKALQTFESKPYSPGRLIRDETLPYTEALFKQKEDWQKARRS